VANIELKSVKALNVEQIDHEISSARKLGEAWPQGTAPVALKLAEEGLKVSGPKLGFNYINRRLITIISP
jgi:hypothetical protein